MPPRPLGVQPQQRRLVLVHLQVLGERGLLRQDPAHSPVPPLLDRAPRALAHRGDRFGPAEDPRGGGGDPVRGGVEVQGEGGEAAAEVGYGFRGGGGWGVGCGEGVFFHGGHIEGGSFLKGLVNGGHVFGYRC